MHSLSMLLVWKRSETSHHLGDERQNSLQHQRIVSRFLAISSASAATTIINYKLKLWQIMAKDVPGRLVAAVVNYCFIHGFHSSL